MFRGTSVGSSGLQRDLNLVRRRAWLFIPFFILGLIIALAFGSVAGNSKAVASMQLETVVQDLVAGGDRGLRIFEAQSMTGDEKFKQEVITAIGDPNFDYARFSIALAPISVADGVSRGILTVSIEDPDKAKAEQYRQAFVDVFTKEYSTTDGLFRQRFVSKKQAVADLDEKTFQDAVAKLRPLAEAKGLPLDELVRSRQFSSAGLVQELNRQEANLQGELAQVEAALGGQGQPSGVAASAILGQPVTDAQAAGALRDRQAVLNAAVAIVRQKRSGLSDVSLDSDFLAQLDSVRTLAETKNESYVRLNNARVAVTSAQSDIATSYSFSGGVAGSNIGRVAVVIAVTVVFGLAAIYLLEWLSQVRAGHSSASPGA
ncbi:MAG: hypothetical protein HYX53_18220 [Chloroflexi bacterium]|nr:hypothetical protein [Chloroflexota bacterium]